MKNKTVHIMDPLQDETCLEGYNKKMAYMPILHTIARRLGLAMGLTNAMEARISTCNKGYIINTGNHL